MTDAYATAELRERVLAAWTASPARFREDANSEDDARTGHADRVVVELAQNAADAAARAGVPGRLVLELTPWCLYAANPGEPLDAAGVESLSHLRVSTKGAGEVGRYGVGFKAVLSLTDEPAVLGSRGGVRWSATTTREAVAGIAPLAGELQRRAGAVPVMRLPWPAPDDDEDARRLVQEGHDTVVRLPLRDDDARRRAAAILEDVDGLLLLFLHGLESIEVRAEGTVRLLRCDRSGDRVVLEDRDTSSSWQVRTSSGPVPAALLADRPVEERERGTWWVSWAARVDGEGGSVRPHLGDRRVRAPQPLDERVDLPAVLAASFPLDPTRGHVAGGPLTSWLCARAAEGYVALLEELPSTPALLALVPAELPAGPVDLALRETLGMLLPRARLLPTGGEKELRLGGESARALDLGAATPAVHAVLSTRMPHLVAADWSDGSRSSGLSALGVRLLRTSDVVEAVHGLDADPSWWGALYAALRAADDRDALRALPVPLADGRLATGPRDLLIPDGDLRGLDDLAAAGIALRVVHADAAAGDAAGTLQLLGARLADVGAVLDDPAVRDAVETSADAEPVADPQLLARGVLRLVSSDPTAARERDWLASLALPDASGYWVPAGELILPASAGGRLAELLAADAPLAPVAETLVAEHGAGVLTAIGVLASFGVVRDADVAVDPPEATHYLHAEEAWLDTCARIAGWYSLVSPVTLPELAGVRDLELVAESTAAWSAALAELGGPDLRDLAVGTTRVVDADGRVADVPLYTDWWLREHEVVPGADGGLHRPGEVVGRGAPAYLRELFPVVADLSAPAAALVEALGAPERLDDLGVDEWAELLHRLGPRGPRLDAEVVRRLYAAAADVLADEEVDQPALVCAELDAALVTVPRAEAVVVDAPDLVPLLASVPLLPAALRDARAVSHVVGVRLASGLAPFAVRTSPAEWVSWDELDLLPGLAARLRLPDAQDLRAALGDRYAVHDGLRVADLASSDRAATWRVAGGVPHVDRGSGVWAVSRAVAYLIGRWDQRDAIAVYLAADETEREHLVHEALVDPPGILFDDEP